MQAEGRGGKFNSRRSCVSPYPSLPAFEKVAEVVILQELEQLARICIRVIE